MAKALMYTTQLLDFTNIFTNIFSNEYVEIILPQFLQYFTCHKRMF